MAQAIARLVGLLAERLPATPRVTMTGEETEIGKTGGELRTLVTRSKDTRLLAVYGYARLVGYNRDFELEPDILELVREMEDESGAPSSEVLEERDELFRQAAEIVITNSAGSTSLLQRRLKIGYGRAARIIDQLHHAGVVGPADGSRAREILVSLQELDELPDEH